ncbi:hypothetical protein NMY22_g18517 [Coprinellus aureogranulatus]|nr:hypothetical protein NMY22_g18517 [Coprinellus aureogranulatus]
MNASTAAPSLQIAERRSLTASDTNLVDILHSRASWIWTPEFRINPPDAASNEQRAFRKTYTIPSGRPTPTNATILVAADDYVVMYVNGVLVYPADPTHDDTTLLAFNVPIPVVEGGSTSFLVLGFRVVNKEGRGGLMVATQVNFENGATDTFYTGLDKSWLGERLFQEHWEQPWFDSTTQASTWLPANVWSKSVRDPAEPTLLKDEVIVYSRLAQSNGTSTELPNIPTGVTGRDGVELSVGGFAGVLVASVLLAAVIGAIGSWFFARRQYYSHGSGWKASDDSASYYGVATYEPSTYEPPTSQDPSTSNVPSTSYNLSTSYPSTSYDPWASHPHTPNDPRTSNPSTSYNPPASYNPPTSSSYDPQSSHEPPAYEPVASPGEGHMLATSQQSTHLLGKTR